jgi:hypothetical protein
MAARSGRRVHEEPSALRREELHDLREKDRRVTTLVNVFRLPSPRSRLTVHGLRLTKAAWTCRRSPAP